jgi:Arc/MetJ-type ribon-helix-helix transcriptional regulator
METTEMTIHLPPDIESSIQAAVHGGQFASVDDAMTQAASLLLERLKHEQSEVVPEQIERDEEPAALPRKPIWERIVERSAAIPDEEWDKLPVDGAEQHDHYLYGTPKRQTAP